MFKQYAYVCVQVQLDVFVRTNASDQCPVLDKVS